MYYRDLIKFPKTDSGKISLPGEFAVAPESPASPLLVYPLESIEGQEILKSGKNELKIVYDCGPVPNMTWDTFECVRQRLQTRWSCLPPLADPLSSALHEKISRCKQEQCDRNLQAYLSS